MSKIKNTNNLSFLRRKTALERGLGNGVWRVPILLTRHAPSPDRHPRSCHISPHDRSQLGTFYYTQTISLHSEAFCYKVHESVFSLDLQTGMWSQLCIYTLLTLRGLHLFRAYVCGAWLWMQKETTNSWKEWVPEQRKLTTWSERCRSISSSSFMALASDASCVNSAFCTKKVDLYHLTCELRILNKQNWFASSYLWTHNSVCTEYLYTILCGNSEFCTDLYHFMYELRILHA